MAEPTKAEPGRTVRPVPGAGEVLRMGMGGIPIQRLGTSESDRVLEKAVAAGIGFFDTARGYPDSEIKFGRVLPRYRDRVLLASKSFSRGAAEMMSDIETSLQQLRTDHNDIYQCHNVASEADLEKVHATAGALTGMVKAREQGKIGHIGISGHKPRILLQGAGGIQAKAFAEEVDLKFAGVQAVGHGRSPMLNPGW